MQYVSATMVLTVKQTMALFGSMLTMVSVARVSVLFLEALSAVRHERNQDTDLLELCKQGLANGSMKMRTACLQAQADRASPIFLKAMLRAVSTAFADFSDSVSSPGKMLIVVLFVLSSMFLPLNSWCRALFPGERSVESSQHIVVLAADPSEVLGRKSISFKERISSALARRKNKCNVSNYCYTDDIECDSLVDMTAVRGKNEDVHAKWD